MKPPRLPWTADEIEILIEIYPHVRSSLIALEFGRPIASIYDKAAKLGLTKSPEYLASPNACRLRRGDNVGTSTRFQPGLIPWNKGTHYVAGGRSAQTRFQPGQMPHNWRPIGHTRETKDGYLQRKTADTGVTRRDYVPIHHLVWRMHGGTIPPGHALGFRDGNAHNFDVNNLELIPRTELMRRNTVHRYPKPVAALIQLRGALNRQINRKTRATT